MKLLYEKQDQLWAELLNLMQRGIFTKQKSCLMINRIGTVLKLCPFSYILPDLKSKEAMEYRINRLSR